jgi:hypothetical protein
MTMRTRDGRPMCELRDRGSDGPVLWVNPSLYSVLRSVIESKTACLVELHFTDGGLAKTSVKMDGERLARTMAQPSATLHPVGVEENFKVT